MNLIATLFPEDPTALNEIVHLETLATTALSQRIEQSLMFWVASAHAAALQHAKSLFKRIEYPHWRILHTEFRPAPSMNDRRAHEIAQGKQFLARAWAAMPWGWICFYDADVELRLDDVLLAASRLRPDLVIKLPYVPRDGHHSRCPDVQLGVFLHFGEILGYDDSVYSTALIRGVRVRRYAPDCLLHRWFLARSMKVETASWARTRHWSSRHTYRQHWCGVISDHLRTNALSAAA